MKTINLVSHTHWDREWYLTFQQFRLRLVHTLDRLLALLDSDLFYRHFMLDGQTILLEDYLQIRPEKTEQIKMLIQSGRVVIGPWYVLADEFLVSPEATLRNLMEGRRICTGFGARMSIGYIPDPFGQIGQLPQILRGFGIESACFWRGLSDEPCELWWHSPDGSRVLTAYLRESYSNAASLTDDQPDVFTLEVKRLAQLLEPFSVTGQLLLMHGTDHAEPNLQTSSCVAYANEHLAGYRIEHTTLPIYMQSVRDAVGSGENLPVVSGELRCSKRMPILPGVLSTRIWIKQRNHQCENLMERWVEPFSAWAQLASPQNPLTSAYLADPAAVIHENWRLLMQCHPHDSICGCSIDQVHAEMRPRFDQVEQVGEQITQQSLSILALAADTRFPGGEEASLLPTALVVFNPGLAPRADRVSVELDLPGSVAAVEILDQDGQVIVHQFEGTAGQEFLNTTFNRRDFLGALGMMQNGRISGWVFKELSLSLDGTSVHVDAVISPGGEPNLAAWNDGLKKLDGFLADPNLNTFLVHARTAASGALTFCAPLVPGCGYRTFWIRPVPLPASGAAPSALNLALEQLKQKALDWLDSSPLRCPVRRVFTRLQAASAFRIENEFFSVEADLKNGTLTLVDRRSGQVYAGLNRFVDGGDCGDEYNYCPPLQDRLVSPEICSMRVSRGAVQEVLEIDLVLTLPAALGGDRQSRSSETCSIPVSTRAVLTRGVARLEILTTVDNQASDHRLRVHFPAPFSAASAHYGGHFEVVERSLESPKFDSTWVEQPRPEVPMRLFATLSDGARALTLASRGLPEVEARPAGENRSEFCLTLLRCVGWLSRDDFSTRKGHAGPFVHTPGAQMPGKYSFEYAVVAHSGTWENGYPQAEAFDLPLRASLTPLHAGSGPASASLVDINGQFSLTCIKMAEDGSGLVVRGYHWERGGEISLRCNLPLLSCRQVRLDETPIQILSAAADGFYRIKARPFEIVTLKFS